MSDAAAERGGPPARPLAAVYFDCDSTLSAIEGIDELLEFAPASLRQDILELTRLTLTRANVDSQGLLKGTLKGKVELEFPGDDRLKARFKAEPCDFNLFQGM